MWKLSAFIVVCGVVLAGCGDAEIVHNPDSFFPEDWKSTYKKKKACTKSPTHGGQYVEVWVNPEGEAAFDDRSRVVPLEAVFLKPQFEDSDCTEPTWWTVMKPKEVAADGKVTWIWQRAELDGSLSINGEGGFCNSCHVGCANGICATP